MHTAADEGAALAVVGHHAAMLDRLTSLTAAVRVVESLFGVHLAKENELLLPALLDDPDVSLAELLEGMHALLGGSGG